MLVKGATGVNVSKVYEWFVSGPPRQPTSSQYRDIYYHIPSFESLAHDKSPNSNDTTRLERKFEMVHLDREL